MKKINKKGFTLIELLVVVLIIGILASIALPQYQKAVFKSKMAEAFTNLKTMKNAIDACEMSNGVGSSICQDVEALDVKIADTKHGDPICAENKNFYYCIDRGNISPSEVAVRAYRKDSDVCICLWDDGHFSGGEGTCNEATGPYPNFDVAKTLNIEEDNDCACC